MSKYEVFVVGDSIVFGLNDPAGGWVTQLKSYFQEREFARGDRVVRVFNLGISGDTTADIVARLGSEFEARWNPGKVPVLVVACGVNDLAYDRITEVAKVEVAAYRANLRSIIEGFLRLPSNQGRCVLLTILPLPPAGDGAVDKRGFVRTNQRVEEYNEVLRSLASDRVDVLDAHGIIDVQDDISGDNLHPNKHGHYKLYDRVRKYILTVILSKL